MKYREPEPRVKKEYLIEAYPWLASGRFNLTQKDCFTLDEFLELRACLFDKLGWDVDIPSENIFNEALELQRKAECCSSTKSYPVVPLTITLDSEDQLKWLFNTTSPDPLKAGCQDPVQMQIHNILSKALNIKINN